MLKNLFIKANIRNGILKQKDKLTILCIIIITSVFYFPIVRDIKNTIISEDDWFGEYFYAAMSRNVITEYHQFPLRTPYLGGGYPSIAHPFDYTLTPFHPLILFLGEVTGLRIIVFFIFIFSAIGMFYLTRYVLEYDLVGGLFSTLIFILCNWGAYHVVDGNINFLYYYFVPWLFAFFIKSQKARRFIIFSCIILTIMVLRAGLSLIPILLALFLFAFLSTFRFSKKKSFGITINPSYLIIFISILTISFFISAAKVIPMYQLYMSKLGCIHLPYEDSYRQISVATKAFGACLNIERIFKAFLDKDFLNYSSMYFGYIPLIIFILSLLIFRLENLRFLILLVIFTLIAFGLNSPIDLFKIIWHIHPAVHGIWRLDKYFNFFIIFFISIIAGKFFSVFRKNDKLQLPILIVAIIGISNMYTNNRLIFKKLIYENKPVVRKYQSFFQAKIEDKTIARERPGFFELKDIRNYQPFWLLLKQNIGVVNFNWAGNIKIAQNTIPKYILPTGDLIGETVYVKGYENLPSDSHLIVDLISAGKLNPDYKGEVFFLNSNNIAELSYFSPNRIEIKVKVINGDKLIINQNYHKSWRVNAGVVTEYKGLLTVTLTKAGNYIVRLKYSPIDFYIGASISLLTITLIIIICLVNCKK